MREVAARAGVSLKTVSRVVNHEPHISVDVIAKVETAIVELKWRPNASAKALRSGKTGIVAVAVPSLIQPFNACLTEALVSEISHRGLQADVTPSPSESRVRKILNSVGHSADSVILIDLPVSGTVAAESPVVSLMRPWPGVDCVMPDLMMGASALAKHLDVLALRDPLLIGYDRFGSYEGEIAAFLTNNGFSELRPSAQFVTTRADGYALAGQLLSGNRPDVVLAGSDDLALGLLSGLTEAGVRVPEDIAVVGFDNLEDGLFSFPSLTSLDPGPALISRIALDLITTRQANPGVDRQSVVVPVNLVRRESTLGIGTL